MFLVDPDNLMDPAIRRGLLIDLEYCLDKDLEELDAKSAWKLLQMYDDRNLDFVRNVRFRRVRGSRTVRTSISSKHVVYDCVREHVHSWPGRYFKDPI